MSFYNNDVQFSNLMRTSHLISKKNLTISCLHRLKRYWLKRKNKSHIGITSQNTSTSAKKTPVFKAKILGQSIMVLESSNINKKKISSLWINLLNNN